MIKKHIDNIVFIPGKTNIRAGGPLGYVANLKEGLEKNHISNVKIVSLDTCSNWKYKIYSFLIRFIPLKKLRHKLREKIKSVNIFEPYDFLRDYARYHPKALQDYLFAQLDKYSFDTITCHGLAEFSMIQKYLKNRRLKAKTLLQSHSPEAPSYELYNTLLTRGVSIEKAEEYRKHAFELDKQAFKDADIILFPSIEAMEPYNEFQDILQKKQIRFIPTGIKPLLQPTETCEELRKKFGVKTKFVISYIGRHTSIKGYDFLKDVAIEILKNNKDVTFLIGGTGDLPPLEHERWIEIGRCNPNQVLKISDAFILPNKQTYFDLILLETLSMGVPVFASNTGGNKTVANKTGCIQLFDNKKQLIKQITEFLKLTRTERSDIKNTILSAFNSFYTQDIFTKNYRDLIKGILNEKS